MSKYLFEISSSEVSCLSAEEIFYFVNADSITLNHSSAHPLEVNT